MSDSLQDQISDGDWELGLPEPIPEDNYILRISDAGDPVLVKDEYQNESKTKKRLWMDFTVDDEDSEFYGMTFRQYMGFSLHAKSTMWPIVKAASGGTLDPKTKINKAWLLNRRFQSSVILSEPNAQGVRTNKIGTPLPLKEKKTSTKKSEPAPVDPKEPSF